MDSKSIFLSKTFWLNLLGPAFLWLGSKYGLQVDAETQAEIVTGGLALANIIMRLFTKGPVHVTAPPAVILLALLAAGGLSACSTAQLQQAQQDIGTVSADVLQTVAAACQEAAPLAAPIANAPAGAVSPGVKSVAGYALSICSPNGTVLAGVKVDPSTAFWLGTLKAALEAATVPAAATKGA